jgi:AbrB family looped-hinge helix DNA binding protein
MKAYVQLSSKGQVVIPAELRERYGLDAGTRFAVEAVDDCIVLRPITHKYIESLRGYFKGGPSLGDIREREHRDDRE